MTREELQKIVEANKKLSEAPVPTDHRMLWDPETQRMLCEHGVNAHEEKTE